MQEINFIAGTPQFVLFTVLVARTQGPGCLGRVLEPKCNKSLKTLFSSDKLLEKTSRFFYVRKKTQFKFDAILSVP
jgi:hypothetical protein